MRVYDNTVYNGITVNQEDKILITGGSGLVGYALNDYLKSLGFKNVLAISRKDVDLEDKVKTKDFFLQFKPKYVFHNAACVYGLGGNSLYKADILLSNARINMNVIESCIYSKVKKVVAMGSGCVYPELEQGYDLKETDIWCGLPHESEDSYAHAKRFMLAHLIAAKKQYNLSSAFVISGNLYGPNDRFNYGKGHVIPSLIKKFYDAKQNGHQVEVWGSGVAVRDFSYSFDVAKALLLILKEIEGPINMGSGFKHSIADIVDVLSEITGVSVLWDSSKPDGQLYRCYNIDNLLKIGYIPSYDLEKGIKETYNWFENNISNIRS